MKGIKTILTYLCCCITTITPAQNTFAFKAKVLHNKKGLMKQFSILVNSEAAVTNDAGVFVIGLNNNATHVNVSLPQTSFVVLYPTGGYLPIPRDLNDIPEIVIGSPQDNTYLNEYLAVYKEMKSNSSATASELIALGKRLDSLQQLLLQLNFTENDLRSAKEMQDGRDRYYPEISQNLEDFVSRAFDIKSALQNLTDFAFENRTALQNMYNAVTEYNNIRNTLNRQRFNYQKYIDEYWQDDSLSAHFNSLIIYALDSVHEGKILTLQNTITQINQYLSNRNNELKERIRREVNDEIPKLSIVLNELKDQNRSFQNELKNNRL